MRSLTAFIAAVTVAGCATVAVQEFDRRYGLRANCLNDRDPDYSRYPASR